MVPKNNSASKKSKNKGPLQDEKDLRQVYAKELETHNSLTLKNIIENKIQSKRGIPRPEIQKQHVLDKIINKIDREKIKYLINGQEKDPIPKSIPTLLDGRQASDADKFFVRTEFKTSKLSATAKGQSKENEDKVSKSMIANASTNSHSEKLKNPSKMSSAKPHRSPRDAPGARTTSKDFKANSAKKSIAITEPSEIEDETNGSNINFYFYNNFNKFIQNLCIKDDQKSSEALKQLEKSRQDKYAPYKATDVPTKKATLLKRPATSKPETTSQTKIGQKIFDQLKAKKDAIEKSDAIVMKSGASPKGEVKKEDILNMMNRHIQATNKISAKPKPQKPDLELKTLSKSKSSKQLEIGDLMNVRKSPKNTLTENKFLSPRVGKY